MAKKVKFPLEMADGAEVRTLEDLREHFDLDSVIGYYVDGRLKEWLESRYYEGEAEQLSALNPDADDFKLSLCKILNVEYPEYANLSAEEIAARNAKIAFLKQITNDSTIIKNVDSVAFTQEELADLLDEDTSPIYLCGKSFSIPIRKDNITYIGVNTPTVNISSSKIVNFDSKKIFFKNIVFCESYQNILEKNTDARVLYSDSRVFEHNGWVYYTCASGHVIFKHYLCRIRSDGSQNVRLCRIRGSCFPIQVVENWVYIYYIVFHRYNMDGDFKEVDLLGNEYGKKKAIVYNERVYFADKENLYSTKLNGSDKKHFAKIDTSGYCVADMSYNSPSDFAIFNGWVYFVSESAIYRQKLDKSYSAKICEIAHISFYGQNKSIQNRFYIENNRLYFMSECDDDTYVLNQVKLDGTDLSTVYEFDSIFNGEFCISNGYIYYLHWPMMGSTESILCRAKLGSRRIPEKIIHWDDILNHGCSIVHFDVIGEYIYVSCNKLSKGYYVVKLSLDGSIQRELWFE